MTATRKKPKPKPRPHILSAIVGGMTACAGTIGSVATPDNIQWLMSHGGRLFSLIAAGLAVVNCIKIFRAPKQ